MRRIYHIGVPPEDLRAKKLIEKLEHVDKIYLVTVPFQLSTGQSHVTDPDIAVTSILPTNGITGSYGCSVPLIFTGEYYGSERGLELAENTYYSSYNPLNLLSLLKALFKTLPNIKLELKGGTIVNLKAAPNSAVIEKVIPTGKRVEVELPAKEGIILKELLRRPGEIVTYKTLISLGIKRENIPVYMSRLRKILEKFEPNFKIKGLRNTGYLLTLRFINNR